MAGPPSRSPHASLGLLTGSLAFISWGLVPLYWKLLQQVPALEILAHRLLWSFVFSIVLLCGYRRWSEINDLLHSPKQILLSILSGIVICGNWFIFIWAVNSGHVLHTSLAYFMTPLVNVLLGAWLFRERLRPLQWAAITLAGIGVSILSLAFGSLPWIALSLCASFALYGVIRKISRAASLPGLFLESAAMIPIFLFYVVHLSRSGASSFTLNDPTTVALLIGSGVVTALPLLWFAHAARNLRLSTLGLLQYLGPTLTFLLGTLVYREPFTRAHLITFGCIWIGLAIYTTESWWQWKQHSRLDDGRETRGISAKDVDACAD